jgi:iron complex outermembrane recepter protein
MKKLKLRTLPHALISALVISPLAFAQQTPQKIEKIEVTGSNIKRVDTETAAPVTIISREDIERSGKPTIAEVLRDIPQNGGQSYNETFTNSFAPGASGIALRGLSQKSTLVLVNGRRTSNYGFAQNLFDTFVDLNSIPSAAVERIEILRDGASAVYGSDAIAGVVNVILRRDYKGLEVGVSGGTSTEGGLNEYRASFGAGFGDVAKDRYNILASVDYYQRAELLLSDRKFTANQDFRQYPGGTLNRATIGAYYSLNGAPNGVGRTPLSTCPQGNRIAASEINTLLSGTTCVYNVAPYLSIFPKTKRLGSLVRGTAEFSSTLQGFGEFAFSTQESFQHFTPGQIANGAITYNPATGGIRSVTNTLPVGNPSNPFSAATNILYTFFDVGGRDTKVNNDAYRGLFGLKGNIGNWDWESAVGQAETKSKSIDYNGINSDVLGAAITGGTYNFLSPSSGSVTAQQLRVDQTRKSDSKLQFFDIKASGEIAQLPAGPLGFAAGYDYRKESLRDTPDANLAAGRVLGRGFTGTTGERNTQAAYVEFSVPVLKQLEAQVAARRDRYSDFGSATSPKVGLKWTVTKEFLVRASVSSGFRAPTLPEASQSNSVSFTTVADPSFGNRNFNIAQVSQSNASLQPEKSKSQNIGFVFEPSTDFNMGVDFYKIRLNNVVARDSNAFIVGQALLGNPLFVSRVIRDPSTGFIIYTIRQVRNLGFLETSGADIDVRKSFRMDDLGKFTLGASYNYVRTYRSAITPGTVPFDFVDSNGFGAIPRYKGNINLAWEKSDWTTSMTYRYIHSYDQFLALGQDRVGSYYDLDAFVRYNGIKNLSLTLSGRNLLDRKPSWDASGGSLGFDFTQYDLRGRYISAGATYKFK